MGIPVNFKAATPIVLLLLALAVWLEKTVFGREVGMIRFVVGVLCIYVAIGYIERQRIQITFQEILKVFKGFREQRLSDSITAAGDPDKRLEAASILVAGLSSGDREVVESALHNLKRLTGNDFGSDPAAWQAWLAAQRDAAGSSPEPDGD